jgi:DNA-binding GntR family transcriptional regulator
VQTLGDITTMVSRTLLTDPTVADRHGWRYYDLTVEDHRVVATVVLSAGVYRQAQQDPGHPEHRRAVEAAAARAAEAATELRARGLDAVADGERIVITPWEGS